MFINQALIRNVNKAIANSSFQNKVTSEFNINCNNIVIRSSVRYSLHYDAFHKSTTLVKVLSKLLPPSINIHIYTIIWTMIIVPTLHALLSGKVSKLVVHTGYGLHL